MRKLVLKVIAGLSAAGLALFSIVTGLSDPEVEAIILGGCAVVVLLMMWALDWYEAPRPFWGALPVFVILLVAAVSVEAYDPPDPPIASWRSDRAVSRVETIPTGHRPRAIAAHGRYVWVVGLKAESKQGMLWRIDSKNLGSAAEEVSSFQARDPYDIAVDGKAIWVTDREGLIKLDLEGNEVWREEVGDGGDNEVDVRFGKVWFKETDMGRIFVLDPDSGAQLRPPVEVGPEAVAIAVGLDSVWVSSSDEEGKPVVVRLAPSGEVRGAIDVLDDPQDLVEGDGYVYTAHSNEEIVSRIDTARGTFGEEVPGPRRLMEGTAPFGGIDAGEEIVWVVLAESNHLFAIAECNFRVIWRIRSDKSPYDVAALRDKAYVPNFHDGNVAVFRSKQRVCDLD